MVTEYIVSRYSADIGTDADARKIAGGPLYPLAELQQLCQDGSGVMLWTKNCVQDVMQLFSGEKDEVARLVRLLSASNFIDSEWCDNGRGAWAACDAYRIRRLERAEHSGNEVSVEYFLKLAINKLGTVMLTVSCHLSR